MSVAVGAFSTSVRCPSGSARCRVTVGLASIVSTLVGWYCSAEVSQGGSCSSRSIVIGAYFAARRGAALAGAAAASVGRRRQSAARPANASPRRRERAITWTNVSAPGGTQAGPAALGGGVSGTSSSTLPAGIFASATTKATAITAANP